MELEPADPIDAVQLEMAELNHRKRRDYALDGDPLSNFFRAAEIMQAQGYPWFTALTAVDALLATKQARMEALASNGRLHDAANETSRDTLLDRAVYDVLRIAIYDRLQGEGTS